MRKYIAILFLLTPLLFLGCQGSIRPRVGAEWQAGENGFVGVGLGEASWGTSELGVGNTRVTVNLAPLWVLLALAAAGAGYYVYRSTRKN